MEAKSAPLLVMSKFFPDYSGPAVRMEKLYEALGFDSIEVICGSTSCSWVENTNYKRFKVTRIPSYFGSRGELKFWLSQIIFGLYCVVVSVEKVRRSHSIHLIGNDTVTSSVLLLAIVFRKRIVYEAVTENAGAYLRFLGLFKIYLPRTATIIAISRHIQNTLISQKFKGDIWCRPNPVDLSLYRRRSKREVSMFRSKLGLKNGTTLLMFVGKFIPQKRQAFLIDVLSFLPTSFHLVLAGPVSAKGVNSLRDKSYLDGLWEQIRRKNLNDRVSVITKFVNSEEFIPFCDFYLSFASPEGLGTTVFEAIASEICVIADEDVPSYRYALEGLQGSILAEADPQQIANLILTKVKQNLSAHLHNDRLSVSNSLSQDKIYAKYRWLLTEAHIEQ